MTPTQFAALTELAGMRGGAAQEAVRLVLVEGLAPAVSAEAVGVSRSTVSDALTRARRVLELSKVLAS